MLIKFLLVSFFTFIFSAQSTVAQLSAKREAEQIHECGQNKISQAKLMEEAEMNEFSVRRIIFGKHLYKGSGVSKSNGLYWRRYLHSREVRKELKEHFKNEADISNWI